MGPLWIAWTIRLSLLCFVAALAMRVSGLDSDRSARIHRWIWTIGFGLFVGHVVAAFQFEHGWSHAAAVEDTRRQTLEKIGVEFGGGVYFNYLFTLTWALDVLCHWLPKLRQTSLMRAILAACLVFMLFIVFNGTIVFKSGWLRWTAVLATLGLAGLLAWQRWVVRPLLIKVDKPHPEDLAIRSSSS